MTLWPTLVRANSQVQKGDPAADADTLLTTTRHVLEQLSLLDCDMNKVIWRQSKLSPASSSNPNGLVPIKLQVEDPLAAMMLCYFASYSIVANRIALSTMKKLACNRGVVEDFEHRIQHQCRRIWMLLEYSCSNKPLGLPIMPAALLVTYEPAKDPTARRRVLTALNELQCGRFGSTPWTAERIGLATAKLLGT